jgi:hypothetical protein
MFCQHSASSAVLAPKPLAAADRVISYLFADSGRGLQNRTRLNAGPLDAAAPQRPSHLRRYGSRVPILGTAVGTSAMGDTAKGSLSCRHHNQRNRCAVTCRTRQDSPPGRCC